MLNQKAFTLFEVMIVMAIFLGVLAATLFFTTSLYQSEVLQTERVIVMQLLQTARSNAQNNLFGSAHGVAFNPPGFVGYVSFVGVTFIESEPSTRQFTPSAPSVVVSTDTSAELVFFPVSGNTHTSGLVRLIDRNRPIASTTIISNEIGYVGW